MSFQPCLPMMNTQIFQTMQHSIKIISESSFPNLIIYLTDSLDFSYLIWSSYHDTSHFNHARQLQLLRFYNIISLKPHNIPLKLFQHLIPPNWYSTWLTPCLWHTWCSLHILIHVTSIIPTYYNYSDSPTLYLFNHTIFLQNYLRYWFPQLWIPLASFLGLVLPHLQDKT